METIRRESYETDLKRALYGDNTKTRDIPDTTPCVKSSTPSERQWFPLRTQGEPSRELATPYRSAKLREMETPTSLSAVGWNHHTPRFQSPKRRTSARLYSVGSPGITP